MSSSSDAHHHQSTYPQIAPQRPRSTASSSSSHQQGTGTGTGIGTGTGTTPHSPSPRYSGNSAALTAGHRHSAGGAPSGSLDSVTISIVKTQIAFLVSTLTEENFEHSKLEIHKHCDRFGAEVHVHLIRRLITASQGVSSPTPTSAPPSSLATRLLKTEIRRLAQDPCIVQRSREALETLGGEALRSFDLAEFVGRLGLEPLEKLVLCSALASASDKTELAAQAVRMINGSSASLSGDGAAGTSSSNILASALDALRDGGQNANFSPNQLADFLASLLSDSPPESPLLDRPQRRALVQAVVDRVGKEVFSQVLQQTLPNLRIDPSRTFVGFLIDLGPDALPSPEVVRAILARFGYTDSSPPEERAIAGMLVELLQAKPADIGGSELTNFGMLVRGLCTFRQQVSWAGVIRAFDEPAYFSLPAGSRLEGLAEVLLAAPRDAHSAAVSGLWGVWSHCLRQLQVLDALVSLPLETFTFVALPGRRVVTVDDVASASPTIKTLAAGVQGSSWNSLDLIETVANIADTDAPDVRMAATELLEKAVKASAELVLMGLIQLPQPWNTVHSELASKLLSMFLAGHPSHQLVFMRIWQVDRNYLLTTFRNFYAENPMNVTRLLDVAQDLKILDSLLDVRPFYFALDVAALASRREYLNLDKWLQDNINEHGSAFIRGALEFLDAKAKDDLAKQDPQAEQSFMPLTVQTVAIFLRVLRSNGDSMAPEEIEYFKVVRNLCLQLHPRLMNLAPGAEGQEPGLQVVTFSAEIHEEADSWYRQMYEEKISIDDVVMLLQRTKVSEDPRDHQIFACMVHTLFDEYRWFEMYYPPRELAMTAIVFGSLIQYQLIDYIPLGIAIRYVLDALRNQPDSNMFKFGLQALLRFQSRLPEWPQLGQALLALPHLQQAHPDIVKLVRASLTSGANGPDADGASHQAQGQVQQIGGPLDGAEEPKAPFTAMDVDPLPDDNDQQEPEEVVSDKILFIVNNLAPSNLEAKLTDARRLITPDIHRWFSSYLVLQRVSIEPNNHGLYTQFLDGMERASLLRHVLHETYAKVRMLLNSDKTVQSTTERTLLKNLGSWLGGLTLARNKPIRHRNIAFKELLIQGYDSNRLIVAIPFVCKVLEQCSKSTVFAPPNPWLMAVLRLLVELYQFAELKLNLKFEIEVLCKSLNVDLKDIQPTTILRSRPPAEILPAQPQSALVQDLERLSMGGYAAAGGRMPPEGAAGPKGKPAQALPSAPQTGAYTDSLASMLQNLANYIVINPQLTLFANNTTLKRMLHVAIDRAIREIIAPVVERSVTIASISTRELITKDFAMESDDLKLRSAAHQMAQNLAGSLALVTCKEPLRISMVTHARTLFLSSGFTEQTLPEQALLVIMQDNLELASSVIEKAAMEKAIPEVDDGLSNAYNARRDHRTRGRGFFWDSSALASSQYAANLPDLLRLKAEGLQPQQLRVYEDFGKFSRAPAAATTEGATPPMGYAALAARAEAPYANSPPAPEASLEVALTGSMSAQQSLEKFSQCISELEKLLAQAAPHGSLGTLPQSHDIRLVVRQVPLLAAQSVNRDETALAFSQKVVQLLYKSESALARDIYVILLERLCEVSVKVAKEVTAWLIYAEDERKFNVPVTVSLIRAGLINIVEQDMQLAKFIVREFRPSVVDFSAKLALECLREPACATRGQLSNTIEALDRAAQRGKATDAAQEFLDELQGGHLKSKADITNGALREQLAYCFAEWVRLFQHSPDSEKSFIDFVTQLQTQGILKGEEISSMFFRVCTEVSVDSYIKQKAIGGSLATGIFSPIDAFSKLVVLMIKYHADPTGANNEQAKVHYLTKILSIVVLVLAQSHEELGPHFQQKPFFRLFSSLLHDLHLIESNLQSAYFQTLLAISNTLNTLQPSFFPGFTFSWMSLISHRLFMPKLLLANNREGWSAFHRLFASLLRFLAPFLRSAELRDTSRSLYKGTLRILLVLLHDFPEFLCDYHHSLCDIVPTSCIQLRNLILSAFPRDRRLPDPFTPNLKIDLLPEINQAPTIMSDYTSAIPAEFKAALDAYMQNRTPQSTLPGLQEVLMNPSARDIDISKGETKYNVPLINALVLYVGITSIERWQNPIEGFAHQDPGIDIFQQMLVGAGSEPEGRYLVLSAMANQLRYPCSHTQYFSYLLLYLFGELPDVRESITRVLLERLIVNRPHPWGLLVTFIELMRNRRYQVPTGPPEIEKLFEHVKSCLNPSLVQT